MAEYTPLASDADVVEQLGRGLTSSEAAKVAAKLKKASELFRKEARQTFTPARSTRRLKVNGGEVRLPESPVTTIHSVTDDDGNAIAWDHDFGVTLRVPLLSHRFVRVDYSHGDDEVPELVVATVAEVVARTFEIDDHAAAGMTQYQEGTGPFTEGGTFAAWAVGAQVLLSPADLAVAHSFRPVPTSNTVVHGTPTASTDRLGLT